MSSMVYGANNTATKTVMKNMEDDEVGEEEACGGRVLAKIMTTLLELAAIFGFWLFFYTRNKKVLKAFPYPMNITTLQFAVGAVVASLTWITGVLERPKLSNAQLVAILPMAMVHTMGSLYSNMSPGKIAVSFTHNTVKAQTEQDSVLPVLHSVMTFLAQLAIPLFVLFLGTIMISQSRTVLSNKTLTVKEEEPLDSINLFSIITVMSLVLMASVTLLTKGVQVTVHPHPMYPMCLLDALCFHAYQQGLYIILARLIRFMSVTQRRRR
ncbi:hypothetical protein BS78_02G141800 [Paspalum vaginatum]|nr:hypothetical protein BS78_02G141800 [Paspalum vaginatum]